MAGASLNPNSVNPKSAKQKSLGETISDVVELVKAYAKQETVDPLKRLGRYLGFGVAGSVLIATGFFLLLLAGLRALQTETGSTFTGSWSWAPYAIVFVATVLIAILFLSFIKPSKKGDQA
ncbi:MAG TPA: phage holin family protein [Acidimicrobiales bacterium]|nr:phage holin family protein [Acidimicrobiales bacterium]